MKNLALSTWAWLEELSEGLIALSGAQAGPVGRPVIEGDEAGPPTLCIAAGFSRTGFMWNQRAGPRR